ncbi:hypothetical protein [Mycobacterium asiaticum]|uniref:PE domain-containing protein n=1 Tax=Mycobacterium asiaticum TaxID=1790 RepID=A0A1A3DA73_MYCAS|nr:hypothetical protein [Mycobacterium asiaticum]OBI95864.1 hypothetical protein A5661_20480 [Mycobacterium asiaticum]OBJ66712.1 hypothetical protein A9W94_06745 [Mycobacterium asiaticum]OBJ84517.1 hypothetical protein A5640_15430 [Mycobacterium asiaticum]ORA11853.1 hypothetical protein BST16_18505 [Mycobacterium asiaticum DSM 44297]
MPPDLKVDIEWLRKDAKLWTDSATALAGFANTAAASKINSPFGSPAVGEMSYDPYTLIQDFLDAYNKFCDAVHDRAKVGETSMNGMGATLVAVANNFAATDIPR